MPENVVKMPRSASPVARAGAGDISERELSRERHNFQTTPPARLQRAHSKKQLFSTPVNKFTAKSCGPSGNLARIRSCLDEYRGLVTPVRPVKIAPKAVSMEDLTPTKRSRKEVIDQHEPAVRSRGLHSVAEEQAAARIGRFMLVAAWRRRRDEVRCLRKTLEFQVSCSERLRMQVSALKSLLDSDNAKVRLAMRELERLKQLVKDKDAEKALLEKEKLALEYDVCASEDRASEMSIGWRNTRNELEGVRAAAASCERALSQERAAAAAARGQRDRAYRRLSDIEGDLAQHENLLAAAEADVATLRREANERQRMLEGMSEQLRLEQEARSECARESGALRASVSQHAGEAECLRAQLASLERRLRIASEQLAWWPAPLTKSVHHTTPHSTSLTVRRLRASVSQHAGEAECLRAQLASLERRLRIASEQLAWWPAPLTKSVHHTTPHSTSLTVRRLRASVSQHAGEAECLRAQLASLERRLRIASEQLAWWPAPLTKSVHHTTPHSTSLTVRRLRASVSQHAGEAECLRAQLASLERRLRIASEQLAWWPAPLTKSVHHTTPHSTSLTVRRLRASVSQHAGEAECLRAQLASLERRLRIASEQLAWWPAPLTKSVHHTTPHSTSLTVRRLRASVSQHAGEAQ